ncbi:tripartite tricarboxylate transporter substrate-binding protein [Rhodospirillum centenum]|uniref:Exported protein, putative n=1 Tax=Rhodospirillum centenum (strain ATCC 51521 / SW) TaxID=414684 RepID=B6IYC5_RHOCS|nr:tripartite tricarboxylate transporter substrate-binding protein [Rhodospirillum centenum]ACJ01299.1 exported protein, putative [Rhodospirillum centenum SW]
MRLTSVIAAAAATVLAAGVLTGPAAAQDYPTRPITMVVPFSAGGPTDTVARLVAQEMSGALGQQVVIENVGGAGGTIGAARVAKAEPDGYTLLLHHIGMATSATLYRKLPFDALADFRAVGLVTDVPMTIVARKDFPADDLKGLVTHVKANADKINMAHAGVGAASHLCGMLFQEALGTPLNTVPYKGTGPAINDLVGGQVDILCDQTTNTTGQIKGGAIKAYAVTTPDRVASLPDLPTTVEAGLPEVQVAVWHGIYAPKGTPDAVVQKLSAALQTALQSDLVKTRFAELGTAPVAQERATPDVHAAFLKEEIERWRPVIQRAGTYAD